MIVSTSSSAIFLHLYFHFVFRNLIVSAECAGDFEDAEVKNVAEMYHVICAPIHCVIGGGWAHLRARSVRWINDVNAGGGIGVIAR